MSSSFYSSSGSDSAVYQSAQDSADNAATSATEAAASLTEFKSLYMGSFQTAPTATQDGSLYYNENTNILYYWNGTAWTATNTSAASTDDVVEGSTNLYHTSERVDDRVNALLQAGSNVTLTYDDVNNTLTIASAAGSGISTTDDVNEGSTNLYFTNARATSAITGSDLDMGGNKVLFGNMYSTEGSLPSASTYHGMFAHVHGTGKGYFAHAGSWHKLLDETSSTTTDLTEGSNLYFTNERVDDRVNALLTAGSNITLSYDDVANTLTIASTASSSGSSSSYLAVNSTGTAASASGTDGIAIGKSASVGSSGTSAIAIGDGSAANNSSSIAIGLNSSTGSYNSSVALGASSSANAHSQLMLGAPTGYTGAFTSIRVGNTNYSPTNAMDLATKQYVDNNSGSGGGATTLSGLNDVSNATPANGQVLTYDSSTSLWQPITPSSGGSGSSTFTGLTDTPSSFTATKFLRVNSGGTALEYATALTPSNLTVANTAASGGGSVSYIPGANGATLNFTPPDLSSYLTDITGQSLYSLSNVNSSASPSDGQVLAWDNANSYWTPVAASSGGGGIALTDLSATTGTAGTAALSYNSTTGVFTLTPPDLSGYATTSSLSSYATTASLATVATSGAYSDLTGTPNLSGYLTGITGESLYSLSNVYTSSSPTDGQVLTWDNANSYWKPTTVSAGSSGIALTDLSVTTATGSGNGGLNYNNSTGVFTFTPADVNSAKPWLATTSTTTATTNSQSESLALGAGATVQTSTGQAIAIGHGAVVSGARGVAIGKSVEADADSTVIGGRYAFTGHVGYGQNNTIVGSLHAVKGTNQAGTTLIGSNTTGKDYSTAIGYQAQADHDYSVALGFDAETTAANQLMLGDPSTTNGFTSIQVGNTSYTPSNAMDLTTKSYVDTNTIGLTDLSVTTASASGSGSLAYNNTTGVFTFTPAASSGGSVNYIASDSTGSATASGSTSLAVGDGSVASGLRSLAVGYGADATASYTTSLGHFAEALGQDGVALGYDTNIASSYTGSAVIGRGATATASNQLMLGQASTSGFTSIQVGNTSYTPSNAMDLTTKDYVDTAVAGAGGGGGSLPQEIAIGTGGSAATSTGTESLAIGSGATTGSSPYSIAIGDAASAQNSIGYNVVIGANNSTTSRYNTILGGYSTGTGSSNFAVVAGWSTSVQAAYSVALGSYASCGNYSNGMTAVGTYSVASGISAVAVGAGYSTTYATKAYGSGQAFGALAYAQSGGIAAGYGAYQTGYQACAVGSNTVALQSNSNAFGNGAYTNTSNQFVLGNSSISDLRCQDTSITAVSDRRDKTNIETLAVGLDFVNAVEPVAFYKNNRADYYVGQYTQDEMYENPELEQTYTFDQTSYEAATQKFDKREFGFIAQDVAAQLPAEYSDARVSYNETDAKHGHDVQRFTMGDMTPILWKALRELSDKHDQLQSDYDALLARVVALENA